MPHNTLPPRYELVLFDLDGTLTDPKVGITSAVQYALAKHGIHEPDRDRLTPFIGPPLHESFMEFYGFPEAQAWQAVEDYREYFADRGIFENEVYPGIPELLAGLSRLGRPGVVATSKPAVYAERILVHFGLRPWLNAVAGSELDGTRVAKAEVVNFALQQFPAVTRTAVVMVGDRRHDIEGARANGIASIGVTYGYGAAEEIDAAQPTHRVSSVAELAELLGV